MNFFSEREVDAIGKSIWVAIGSDPVLPLKDFPTLTGVSVDEALKTADAWSNVNLLDRSTWRTIWGVFHNLWGYPHRQADRVFLVTGCQRQEFKEFREKIRALVPDPPKNVNMNLR